MIDNSKFKKIIWKYSENTINVFWLRSNCPTIIKLELSMNDRIGSKIKIFISPIFLKFVTP